MATATWNFPRPFFPQTRTMSTTITPATRLSFSNPTDLRSFLPSISLHAPSGLSNGVFCRTSGYNVQIVVGEDEPEEVLMRRFRREVSRAGIIPECRRRKYFENKQEAKKRKTREAAKRNRRRPRFTSSSSSSSFSNKKDAPPKKAREEDSDNWEMPDGDLPFF